jgi:glycosyltransferase involved in cell wall biosynthesis
MTPTPLVSVVIPAYNAERFLAETLRSVLAQDYDPIEVIVVDDGSTDATAQIARSHGVRCLTQPNRGQAAARNAGTAAAHGEFIALVDADDTWTPDKTSRQVAHLLAHPELGFVLAHMQKHLDPGAPPPPGAPPGWFSQLHAGTSTSAMLARRSVMIEVGGFDTRYRIGSDTDWLARALDAGFPWTLLPDVLVHCRVHGDNLSYQRDAMKSELFDALRASVARKHASGREGEPTHE